MKLVGNQLADVVRVVVLSAATSSEHLVLNIQDRHPIIVIVENAIGIAVEEGEALALQEILPTQEIREHVVAPAEAKRVITGPTTHHVVAEIAP